MWLHVVALVVAAGVFGCCCHSLSILIYLNWSNFAKKMQQIARQESSLSRGISCSGKGLLDERQVIFILFRKFWTYPMNMGIAEQTRNQFIFERHLAVDWGRLAIFRPHHKRDVSNKLYTYCYRTNHLSKLFHICICVLKASCGRMRVNIVSLHLEGIVC